ncbi:MAG: hypothetical protein OXT09_11940 [Myxococcales bacterium]|nr:hypothetical protein [Myxococcales bacterium]
MKKFLVLVLSFLVIATAVQPQVAMASRRPPVPAEQWDPQVQLWLARAMVAEAGWLHERDHVAIAYVLARRWKRVTERYPTMRFLDVIRNYCAGLGGFRRSLTPRQTWLRSLWPDASQPEGWPRKVSWRRHAPLWRATFERAGDFARGELRDPCRGRAWHWGGTIDSPRGRMAAIDCGETANTFYRLVPRD